MSAWRRACVSRCALLCYPPCVCFVVFCQVLLDYAVQCCVLFGCGMLLTCCWHAVDMLAVLCVSCVMLYCSVTLYYTVFSMLCLSVCYFMIWYFFRVSLSHRVLSCFVQCRHWLRDFLFIWGRTGWGNCPSKCGQNFEIFLFIPRLSLSSHDLLPCHVPPCCFWHINCRAIMSFESSVHLFTQRIHKKRYLSPNAYR